MTVIMVKKRPIHLTLLLLCLTFIGTPLFAQRTHAVSAGIGTAYYYGELTDVFASTQFKPAFTLGYQSYFTPLTSYRFSFSAGQVGATDFYANDPRRKIRNLQFKSIILEASAVMVQELFPDKNYGNEYLAKPHFSPYVWGGASFFYFDPKGRLGDTWYALQPLGTEGQTLPGGRGKYSRLQMALPIGIGFSVRVSQNAGINFDLGYRLTLTDYLDDISTVYPDLDLLAEVSPLAAELSERSEEGVFQAGDIRGNPGSNDGYFVATFSFTYYLSRYLSRN